MSGYCSQCGQTGGCDCPKPPPSTDTPERKLIEGTILDLRACGCDSCLRNASAIEALLSRVDKLEDRVRSLEATLKDTKDQLWLVTKSRLALNRSAS
jgi:hypothetical protein